MLLGWKENILQREILVLRTFKISKDIYCVLALNL